MRARSELKLLRSLRAGKVYRRDKLRARSTAVDRDLKKLSEEGVLVKAGPGLYYKPKVSRFGPLPADEHDLIKAFLSDDKFLLFSWNNYNALGLGLTQLYNSYVVYNLKRHEQIQLGGKLYDFNRPTRGFPSKLSKEYLLVDLVNNISALGENEEEMKLKIENQFKNFDRQTVKKLVTKYGKKNTKKFFEDLCKKI